jgi:hypothetical protein
MKFIKTGLYLGISATLSVCGVLLLRTHVQYEGIVEDLSSWNSFFNVFGVVYAIVAGFLLITVLNRYSALNQAVEDELNAIESIRDFLVYFDDEQLDAKSSLERALANYTRSFSEREWQEMSNPHNPMNSDTSEELYELMRQGKAIRIEGEKNNIIFSALVENISELTKLRTRRIALSNERLPTRLHILMLFMSLVLAGAFILLGVRGALPHVAMLVALVISIHLLYMVIKDLDHPFFGVWNINKTLLEELVKRFEEEVVTY